MRGIAKRVFGEFRPGLERAREQAQMYVKCLDICAREARENREKVCLEKLDICVREVEENRDRCV